MFFFIFDRVDLYITGIQISEELLGEAMEVANLSNVPKDYLEADFRAICEEIIPGTIANDEIIATFIHLKASLASLVSTYSRQ